MPRSRRPAFAALAAAVLLVGLFSTAAGQAPQKDPFLRPYEASGIGDSRTAVNEMRDGKRLFTPAAQAERNRKDLDVMARYLVHRVTDRAAFFKTFEPTKANELRPPATEATVQSLLNDLDVYTLKPTAGSKYSPEQADYIKEFGAALDRVFKPLLADQTMPPEIRVNAARMLAAAARSGAPALGPTITALINDPKTRPEVLVYALKAAENLLAAYDPLRLLGDTPYLHTLAPLELYELLVALDRVVSWSVLPFPAGAKDFVRPAPVAPPPAADPKTPPPAGGKTPPPVKTPGVAGGQLQASNDALPDDQVAVLHFFRRAAIRAVAQARVPIVGKPNSGDAARPVWTLAKIAAADVAVSPPPFPDEVAEAVIGLCGYQSYKGVDVDVVLDTVAAGVMNFARPKVATADDKTIPWKQYAARLGQAFADWKKGSTATAGLTRYVPKIASLADAVTADVLVPVEKTGATATRPPDIEAIAGWRTRNPVAAMQPFLDMKPDDAKKFLLTPAVRGN